MSDHPADVEATWTGTGNAERLLDRQQRMEFEEGVRRLVERHPTNQK